MDSTTRLPTPVHFVLAATILSLMSSFASRAEADDKDSKKAAQQQVEFGIGVARQGLWQEAIFRWKRAVELDPDNAKARNNLGVAYEQAGDFELAEKEYERALELEPGSVQIRQNYELFRESYEKRKRKERDTGGR